METLLKHIKNLKTQEDLSDFLISLFTLDEIAELEKRIEIVSLLLKGHSQRDISEKLKVGIATVSRGSTELKKGNFKFLKRSHGAR